MVNWSLNFVPDLAINHVQFNTLLLDGQIGIETDTGKFKIGDGVTGWNNLGFAQSGDITSLWMGVSSQAGNMLSHSPTDGGIVLSPEQFNARLALLGGINGQYTFDNISAYYASSPHLAGIANIGVIIKNIVNALGSDYANAGTTNVSVLSVQERLETIVNDMETGNFDMTKVLKDNLTALTSTWSSSKITAQINTLVNAAISNIVGAAPEALNTIYELADFMLTNNNMVTTLAQELGLMVKYVEQNLDAAQQAQARANIGAASAEDVGSIADQGNKTFVEEFDWVMTRTITSRPLTHPALA